jgi:fibronectin-binding autotransporter adhesin
MSRKGLTSMVARLVVILVLMAGMLGMRPTKTVHAATLVVTNNLSSGPGSLAAALSAASSGDTITFDQALAGQTIVISLNVLLSQKIILDGSGLSPQVTIDGNGTGAFRFIGQSTFDIYDLTFTNLAEPLMFKADTNIINSTFDGFNEEAIVNLGNSLIIVNSIFSDNNDTAINNNFGGSINIDRSTLMGNSGRAITNNGQLTVGNSTFIDNSDGAIQNNGGSVTLKNTTIFLNKTNGSGAALSSNGSGNVIIANSTISQNQSGSNGALYINGNNVDVFNSTIAGNIGGEYHFNGNVANIYNSAFVCTDDSDCYNSELATVNTFNSIVNSGTLTDFGLAELADNGGPAKTMALLPESPLVDAGDDSICANAQVNNLDQRGITRPQGYHCDIGAYELPSIKVTKTTDTSDGICNEDCSLREALAAATPGYQVVFDRSLAGQTLTLTSNLVIDKDIRIDGSGFSPQVLISGGNVAHIEIEAWTNVAISDLTIANGYSSIGGGAIRSIGFLTITNSTLRNNYSSDNCGAIESYASLTLRNTTLYQNQAVRHGGAVCIASYIYDSIIVNSTITQNQAGTEGGAIYVYGTGVGTIHNSTIAGNAAASGGVELFISGAAEFSAFNTIIACSTDANYACYSGGIFLSNSIMDAGTFADFGLAELGDNGGPNQTMALLPDSPLIDAGDDAVCANVWVKNLDQRGVTRPQGVHCDIGAYEKIIHHVKWDATGANNGSSWTDAYTDLQSALVRRLSRGRDLGRSGDVQTNFRGGSKRVFCPQERGGSLWWLCRE